ncbi:MAG: RsmD family RNA methyltransferase [Planctomycetaceae bacterium]|nr:RsmD family RNA methyltransferase [Planctomycetaceae bacterium]
MSLRIISGRYRRRLLKTPSDDSTRPYTDRVRQMTFDRLAAFIPGARVADIFAGVGTMGMESLSRGAHSCVFYESSTEIHELLQNNVRTIAPDANAICWRTDVRKTSFRPRGGEDFVPYSLIFFDPPYRIAEEIQPRKSLAPIFKRLAKETLSTPEAIMVLRTPEHFETPDVAGWVVHDCWELSSMMIWIMTKPDAFTEDRERAAGTWVEPDEQSDATEETEDFGADLELDSEDEADDSEDEFDDEADEENT